MGSVKTGVDERTETSADKMRVQSSEVTIVWEEAKETKKEVLELNTVGARREEEEKKGSLVDETEKKIQDEETKWTVFKY